MRGGQKEDGGRQVLENDRRLVLLWERTGADADTLGEFAAAQEDAFDHCYS